MQAFCSPHMAQPLVPATTQAGSCTVARPRGCEGDHLRCSKIGGTYAGVLLSSIWPAK